ncbi:MAG: hypothetical protein KUA43_13870 [Hoeflea sp.]|uniref:hypothetical protein n=1 Tax=Hoeflea sp. TaxID=1940281 RepID=UPI001E03A7A2|nr:hypothetical protein [Hoeflea sp.]MBU4531246.1 hypothetical protein [Alphaproteobacteria bacterium]MBU4545691.1 hypothetical protein [Alphaproteobacteria bacterium]MBU4550660.1 hypothetical protein [Alphaproteobacteria bacterium]MBV1724523.1 hypothetical protein [Hoeflea sp.]MBV1760543.1 hypothetical protein [Hoeflea sp.]
MRRAIAAAIFGVMTCSRVAAMDPPRNNDEENVYYAAAASTVCVNLMSVLFQSSMTASQNGVGQYRIQELIAAGAGEGVKKILNLRKELGDDFAKRMDARCAEIEAQISDD